MAPQTSSGKLAYIAIMLVAVGCLLLYFIRTNSRPGKPETPTLPESQRPTLPATPPSVAQRPDAHAVMPSADAEAIKLALAAGMDPRAPLTSGHYQGLSPLHIVAMRELAGVIAPMVAAGADIDTRAPDGRTPLMVAAAKGGNSPQIISELLLANAAIDIRDSQGRTALMHAAGAGRAEAVDALIKAGADVKALDSAGNSPLAYAASVPGNSTSLTLLLNAGADPEVTDAHGVTPLMKAAERGDAAQIVALLNAGANPTVKSKDGRSALDRARARTDDRGPEVAGVLEQAS